MCGFKNITMTKKIKFVSIASFTKEDLKSLFDFICAKIIEIPALKVKQDVLKLKGTPKELNDYNPTISSILTLIATYNLDFEFKIHYVENEEDDFSGLPETKTDLVKKMDAQAQDIKPGVMDSVNIPEKIKLPVEIPQKETPTEELPDFD